MQIDITDSLSGKTIKYILTSHLGYSRACISDLKKRDDGILLNSKHVTVREIVSCGDILTLNYKDADVIKKDYFERFDYPLEILYEDDDCVVINKPFGMPTHESHGHYGDSLSSALQTYYSDLGIPFVFRAVNRLDRQTSGVVLIAKNKPSAHYLSAQMKARKINKMYIALLHGKLKDDSGTIEGYVAREKESIIIRRFYDTGKESDFAITEWKKLWENDEYTLVSAHPVTGKTHQLRVHFAHMGAPISGDELYGDDKEGVCHRLCLHAKELDFEIYGKEIHIDTGMPQEIQKYTEEIQWKK